MREDATAERKNFFFRLNLLIFFNDEILRDVKVENETRQDMETTKERKERIFRFSHSNEQQSRISYFLLACMTVIFSDVSPFQLNSISMSHPMEQSGSAKKGRKICLENPSRMVGIQSVTVYSSWIHFKFDSKWIFQLTNWKIPIIVGCQHSIKIPNCT